MKYLGILLTLIGLVLMVVVIFDYFRELNRVKSPIPDDKGIKVIFITPTK